MPVAFITGSSGQDGQWLIRLLESKGYTMHVFSGDLVDAAAVKLSVRDARPDECYHLGAQTFVPNAENSTLRVNVEGTLNVLEALRFEAPQCRMFFAGSAEMFGNVTQSPQDESTPMQPRSLYGVSKLAAYHLVRIYRQQYNLFVSCGILYNHESSVRRREFVTRKITRAAARIKAGIETELVLGNLDTTRDWGHARDYVEAMWLMLQLDNPDDYVIATGTGRTIREFVEAAFGAVGLDWQKYVRTSQEYWRPAEAVPLVGNAAKLRAATGWHPRTSFSQLIAEMIKADLAEVAA